MSFRIPLSYSHLHSSTSSLGSRRALPPSGTVLPKLPPLTHSAALLGSGLTTPPVDDMSTTYQPAPASYDSHSLHGYPSSSLAPTAGRRLDVPNDPRNSQYYRYPSQQNHQVPQTQVQPISSSTQSSSFAPANLVSAPQLSSRPSTPSPEVPMAMSQTITASRLDSETLIYHSLQIPKCISSKGGNLAAFAAQVRPAWP